MQAKPIPKIIGIKRRQDDGLVSRRPLNIKTAEPIKQTRTPAIQTGTGKRL